MDLLTKPSRGAGCRIELRIASLTTGTLVNWETCITTLPRMCCTRNSRCKEEVAGQVGESEGEVRKVVDSCPPQAPCRAHAKRPTPTSSTVRCIPVGMPWMSRRTWRPLSVLRLGPVREFALVTLKRLLAEAWDGEETLYHVIAYGDDSSGAVRASERVSGTLDDYAFTVHACIDGWMASGKMDFYEGRDQAGGCHDCALL